MYDAIIVGARAAGSSTAMLLARKGYCVLMVDRATFPSDTISGHFIMHPGVVQLHRWGLLDKVIASGCPPINKVSSNFGDFTLTGHTPPELGDLPFAIGPRRTVLDTLLAEAAVEAGAELRQGFTVTDVSCDNGQVVGIQGHGQDGASVTERARIVIGADGKHSKIAQLVEAPRYKEVPSLTCWYMSYWSGYPSEGLEVNWRHHRIIFSFPTNDGLVLHAVAWPHAEFHDFRSNIEQNYVDTLMMMPDIAERLPDARRESQFYAMADLPGFFCKPYGPGWALVGDAGHHKDPTPAYGISDAFLDAELLADAIHNGFSGEQSLENALADYEQRRNARAIPDHEATHEQARLEMWDAPEALSLRAAMRHNAEATDRFCAMVTRAIPREAFFTPKNLFQIIGVRGMSRIVLSKLLQRPQQRAS
jgi:flavin-dependent dehydrogenase